MWKNGKVIRKISPWQSTKLHTVPRRWYVPSIVPRSFRPWRVPGLRMHCESQRVALVAPKNHTLMWPPLGSRHLSEIKLWLHPESFGGFRFSESPRSQAPNQRISTERHPNESRDHQDNHLEPYANMLMLEIVRTWHENMWPKQQSTYQHSEYKVSYVSI